MTLLNEQLPLAVQLRDDATFDNFFTGANGLLISELRRQLSGGENYLYIYGGLGSGRSHLLQAACHWAGQHQHDAVFLPLDELVDYPPQQLLEGLEQQHLLCLDNIEAVLGNKIWEEALFHLFNRCRDAGTCLLISAASAVRELSVTLPDLRSRLSWGVLYQLQPLTDEDRAQVLRMRAEQRGVELPEDVCQFIVQRSQRDMPALMKTLAILDDASLRERRRITKPFIKNILGW
jgi:DnaA family protein